MKKIYLKPDAEYISFYSDEEITSVQPLDKYANGSGDGDMDPDLSGAGEVKPLPGGGGYGDWD